MLSGQSLLLLLNLLREGSVNVVHLVGMPHVPFQARVKLSLSYVVFFEDSLAISLQKSRVAGMLFLTDAVCQGIVVQQLLHLSR